MLKKIKHVFQYGHIWWQYYLAHKEILRSAVIHNMINMLSCGTSSRGHALYDCPNPECTHTKRVLFTCKSRGCPSCGKKATYQ